MVQIMYHFKKASQKNCVLGSRKSEKYTLLYQCNVVREKETTDFSTIVNWFSKHDHLANQTTIIHHHYDFGIISRD